ncbi:hypothetical protein [Actinoallomurus sp. CA-142502]|uniref:hypothetical protein n=1 Tax=Actinoallomurus sp. CA-142502 TaxID=3239885 RepID=UPI003D947621
MRGNRDTKTATSAPAPAALVVRNEETLRSMWGEHLKLRRMAAEQAQIEKNATEDAVAAERTAMAHRTTAEKAHNVGASMSDSSDDLADMVNEKRAAMNLPPLVPGAPYDPPADVAEQAGQPVAGAAPENGVLPPGVVPVGPELGSALDTRHDGHMPLVQNGRPGGASA